MRPDKHFAHHPVCARIWESLMRAATPPRRGGEKLITTAFVALMACLVVHAQTGAKNGEWRTYGGDLGNTHYSPLDQINAANFNMLEVAWRFKTENLGPRPETNLQSTPLMANGVL